MPTFSTPHPIDLAVNVQVGGLEVIASDRTDTIVTVTPTTDRAIDRRAAEETRVEFDGSRLTVTGPKPRFSIIGPTESADVRIELPTGSRFTAEVSVGGVRTTGRLGATRVKNSTGWVELDATDDVWLRAGHGTATVGTANGTAEITADHGQIRIGTVTGDVLLKASHGSIRIADAGGEVDAKLSYGDLEIATARASVTAKTAYGSLEVRDASAGSLQLESAYGQITVGIRAGVPAWLDLASKEGRVRNQLDSDAAPAESEQSIAVRARTQYGDITIQRANK